MLRPFSLISIQQITPFYSDGVKTVRDRLISIDFAIDYEICSTWKDHTDKATITFPKNIILKTNKFLFQQSGTYNVILGGTGAIQNGQNVDANGKRITAAPLFMRGDMVTIQHGYWYRNEQGKDVQVGDTRFSGYISKIDSSTPIKIECEDNFYLLKRTPLDVNIWQKEIVSLCQHMTTLVNSNFHDLDDRYPEISFSDDIDSLTMNFSLGHLDIGNVTCSELLSRLKSQYRMESYFVGNVLHFGLKTYKDNDSIRKNFFEFENNIIESDLEYMTKGDIVLSAVVDAINIVKTGKETQDGEDATKRSRKSMLVYWDIPSSSFKSHIKQKNEPFPKNEGGERYHFIYAINPNSPVPSDETLFEFGKAQLEKYYYTGFKGSFTTFGYPFVKWGDNINLISKVFSDRNGVYKVEKVDDRGGVNGLRQTITIAYRLNVSTPTSTRKIVMR